MRRFYQITFSNLSSFGFKKWERKNWTFKTSEKPFFLRTTCIKVKYLSDRTSSFSVFFQQTYSFCKKHLPIRSSFLKLFCSKNELLDFKLQGSAVSRIFALSKIFFAMLFSSTSRYCPAFFPASNCLRKPEIRVQSWATDWFRKFEFPYSASRCPPPPRPGRVQMLSLR